MLDQQSGLDYEFGGVGVRISSGARRDYTGRRMFIFMVGSHVAHDCNAWILAITARLPARVSPRDLCLKGDTSPYFQVCHKKEPRRSSGFERAVEDGWQHASHCDRCGCGRPGIWTAFQRNRSRVAYTRNDNHFCRLRGISVGRSQGPFASAGRRPREGRTVRWRPVRDYRHP